MSLILPTFRLYMNSFILLLIFVIIYLWISIDILYHTHRLHVFILYYCLFLWNSTLIYFQETSRLEEPKLSWGSPPSQAGTHLTQLYKAHMHKYSFEQVTLVYSIVYSTVVAIQLFELRERDGQMCMCRRREMIQGRNAAEWMTFMNGEICEFAVCGGGMDRWMDEWMNGLFELLLHVATYGSRPPHSLLQMSCSIIITGQHDTTHTHTHWAALQSYLCYDGMLLQAHGDPVLW